MNNRFIRTQMLVGGNGMKKLAESRVIVFGIGGVGGYVCEALARGGVGNIVLVDNDVVSLSNLNRQIIATEETVGMLKTEAMGKRIKSINPECRVEIHNVFYLPGEEGIVTGDADYVVDAIDTVSGKIQIVLDAQALGVPVISSMGTGNKLFPQMLEISDIYKTSVCPLAKVMRRELKARGVKRLKVVYSKEKPVKPALSTGELSEYGEKSNKRVTPGSVSFVPPAAGLLIAGEVIRNILEGI